MHVTKEDAHASGLLELWRRSMPVRVCLFEGFDLVGGLEWGVLGLHLREVRCMGKRR
jgi:hypothetical protein